MAAESYYLRREITDPAQKEKRLARIEELENEIFERSAQIVNAVLSFVEVGAKQTEPPQAWIDEYGEEAARQRLEVARAGWLPAAVSPAGFKYAQMAMAGISRGRKWNLRVTQNTVNVKLELPVPTTAEHPGPTTYEVRDLET